MFSETLFNHLHCFVGTTRKFVFATDKQILIFIAVWLMVSAIPALAELPDAIVDTPEELQKVETQQAPVQVLVVPPEKKKNFACAG